MRVAVLGAGAWGTAIACVLGARMEVALWARDAQQARVLSQTRRNERYLRGIEIPAGVSITGDLAQATSAISLALVATPVAGLRALLQKLQPPLVWLCKGFEQGSGALPHQIAAEVLGEKALFGALSGPSFAEEVARGLPCALTLASRDAAFAREAAAIVHGGRMRVYYSADLVGVEIGGAVKNVIALAAGVSDGLGFGHNTRAALITRGLAEISRLAIHLGANPQTLYGLSCLGDLVLTCTGDLSRNRTVGLRLGKGERLEEIVASMNEVAEGVRNTASIRGLARSAGIEMPITDQMFALLYEGKDPSQAVVDLTARRLRQELD
jgi:glycerol-3-phosphate dehydrogenase (NAD(P)+)